MNAAAQSHRYQKHEKLRRGPARLSLLPPDSTIAGIVFGENDRIPEANDAFLKIVGYSREEFQADGLLQWPDLTPPGQLDELAHEDGLRFGACTPFEKDLIRKDGF